MKKSSKYSPKTSIQDLFDYIEPDSYTRQTIASLFRCFLETIIENRYPSVIFARLKDSHAFKGLLNRLKYTESKVYSFSENIRGFNRVESSHPGLQNDEFLIIVAERFTACICWSGDDSDVFGLCEGFCSLNPSDVKLIVDFLGEVAYDPNVENDLSAILQDRRNNEKFTTILRKLVISLENRQRDLICANTELKDLHQKALEAEDYGSKKDNSFNSSISCINDEFLLHIAHELRNPIGMMELHSQIITRHLQSVSGDDEKIETLKNSASIVNLACQSLEALVSELSQGNQDSGGIVLQKTKGNIQNTALEVVNLVKPMFEENGIKISFENKSKQELDLFYDNEKVRQCLINLVKNALEASSKGQEIKISIEEDNLGKNILVKVSDEGEGILQENMEKVFLPNFTTKENGSGIGLARSRQIANAHGGSLYIEDNGTKENKGTTFVFLLPIKN